ncbi:MAG: hypothetical protein J5747_12515 [Spirochaetaceae bacterium]|nr:hypothetical protein [Spirochaetaceae bacterium]
MKVKLVPTLIIAGISALIGYGFYAANSNDGNAGCWIMLAVSAVSLFVTLGGGFGIRYKESGSAVNIVVISVIFSIVELIINLISTFATFHVAPYIIVSGTVLLVYVGIAYAMAKAL